MFMTPQVTIDDFQKVELRCTGCVKTARKMFGKDADRVICRRHPFPHMQFLFGNCECYRPSPHIRELISIIENILVTKR
jgi:hypothetical protein